MKTPATRSAATLAPAATRAVAQVDQRPAATVQRQMQQAIEASPRQVAQRQQAKALPAHPNQTGLPNHLKAGIENLSGHSLDDVRVHYNSGKPAQLQALAYAQGTNIHVAPGQEHHLPHEAWHVVQQKQGRVRPTMQLQGTNVNDNQGLEGEADRMGAKAATHSAVFYAPAPASQNPTTVAQRREMVAPIPEAGRAAQGRPVVQRVSWPWSWFGGKKPALTETSSLLADAERNPVEQKQDAPLASQETGDAARYTGIGAKVLSALGGAGSAVYSGTEAVMQGLHHAVSPTASHAVNYTSGGLSAISSVLNSGVNAHAAAKETNSVKKDISKLNAFSSGLSFGSSVLKMTGVGDDAPSLGSGFLGGATGFSGLIDMTTGDTQQSLAEKELEKLPSQPELPSEQLQTDLARNEQNSRWRLGKGQYISGGLKALSGFATGVGIPYLPTVAYGASALTNIGSSLYDKRRNNQESREIIAKYQNTQDGGETSEVKKLVEESKEGIKPTGTLRQNPLKYVYSKLPYVVSSEEAARIEYIRKNMPKASVDRRDESMV